LVPRLGFSRLMRS